MTERPSSTERKRPRISAMEIGPGPAAYTVPTTTGFRGHDPSRAQSPAFSFGCKTKQFSSINTSTIKSPGPVHFVEPNMTRRGRDGTAVYSMRRQLPVRSEKRSPGPAAYNIITVTVLSVRPPAYSFGKRLTQRDNRASVPSPAKYTLPSLTGPAVPNARSSPAYSILGRLKVGGFSDNLSKTPGPATYKVVSPEVTGPRSCAYSMYPRTPAVEDLSRKPGPNKYGSEKMLCNRQQSPAYTFGIKHSPYVHAPPVMVV